jgi:hypothetical protein
MRAQAAQAHYKRMCEGHAYPWQVVIEGPWFANPFLTFFPQTEDAMQLQE